MNYSAFRFRAVVDFVEFEVETARPTNFQTLQRTLGRDELDRKRYVEGLNEGSGGAATRFTFKTYDPANWTVVQAKLDALDRVHPLVAQPRVTALETSFDAYSRSNDPDELAQLAAGFYRFLKQPASSNHRFVGKTKHSGMATGDVAYNERIFAGRKYSLYVGNHRPGINRKTGVAWDADDLAQRVYLKEIDRKLPLSVDDHRARIELTQRGDALPFRNVDEQAQAFRFESLAPFFAWMKLRDGLTKLEQTAAEAIPQIGERRVRTRRGGGTRLHSKLAQADSELNGRARDALRDLTRRMQGNGRA